MEDGGFHEFHRNVMWLIPHEAKWDLRGPERALIVILALAFRSYVTELVTTSLGLRWAILHPVLRML